MDLLPTNCVPVAGVCFLLELLHMSEENGFMDRNLPDNQDRWDSEQGKDPGSSASS